MSDPQMLCPICDRLLAVPVVGMDPDPDHPGRYVVVQVVNVHPPGGLLSPGKTAGVWFHTDCLMATGRKVELGAGDVG